METAIAITFLSLFVILTVQAGLDILKNIALTKKERTNLLSLVILFPIGGYLIYFFYYKRKNIRRIS